MAKKFNAKFKSGRAKGKHDRYHSGASKTPKRDKLIPPQHDVYGHAGQDYGMQSGSFTPPAGSGPNQSLAGYQQGGNGEMCDNAECCD